MKECESCCANQKQMGRWITIAVAMGLVCASHVSAQKPIKPPPPPSANLVNLGPGSPRAMNQLDSFVEIVGSDGSGWGRYWMVDSTGTLVDSFDLETLPGAIRLEPFDINNQGQIVGFQDDRMGFLRRLSGHLHRVCLWSCRYQGIGRHGDFHQRRRNRRWPCLGPGDRVNIA
jgi:hypothetical protein